MSGEVENVNRSANPAQSNAAAPGQPQAAEKEEAGIERVSAQSKEISDISLGDLVRWLDMIPKYLRALSLSVRSMYSTSTAYVPEFASLQKDFAQEAAVLRIFLVPLTIEVVIQLQRLLVHYLENRFEVWSRQINDSARAVKEFQVLFHCLVAFYEHLKNDLARFQEQVEAVRKALVQETMKFQREAGVLGIRSLIKDDVFVSLLFVPNVDFYAAPLVHGGEKKEFTKPVVAKDQFEWAVAAAMTIQDSLTPAVVKLERLISDIDNFFVDWLEELHALGADSSPPPPPKKRDPWANYGKTQEEIRKEEEDEEEEEEKNALLVLPPAELAAREAKRSRHYEIVRPKAYWIEKSCREMMALSGNVNSDMLSTPTPEPKDYPQNWLENKKNKAGEDIIDVARAATQNVEITDAMDPC